MTNSDKNQALSDELLDDLERGLKRIDQLDRIADANIKIKTESGYTEAISINAHIDEWRKRDRGRYAALRRKKAEEAAAAQGRTLRSYEPATPERRKDQLRTSKERQRLDPTFAAAEQAVNTAARRAKRAAMTEEERAEANRKQRERRVAKKPVL